MEDNSNTPGVADTVCTPVASSCAIQDIGHVELARIFSERVHALNLALDLAEALREGS
jgi:hypothetical protein